MNIVINIECSAAPLHMYTGALDTGLLLFGLPVVVCDSDVPALNIFGVRIVLYRRTHAFFFTCNDR